MKLLPLVLATAFVAGCSQDTVEIDQTAQEAVPQDAQTAPILLPQEEAQKIAIYTSLASLGCKSAVAYRDLILMGGKPSMTRPTESQSSEFSALHSAISEFLELRDSVKAFRSAELECFSNPSNRASEVLTTRRSEVEMNLELVSERAQAHVQKTLPELERELDELKRKVASREVPDDFVSEAVISALEDDIEQARMEQSTK